MDWLNSVAEKHDDKVMGAAIALLYEPDFRETKATVEPLKTFLNYRERIIIMYCRACIDERLNMYGHRNDPPSLLAQHTTRATWLKPIIDHESFLWFGPRPEDIVETGLVNVREVVERLRNTTKVKGAFGLALFLKDPFHAIEEVQLQRFLTKMVEDINNVRSVGNLEAAKKMYETFERVYR